MRADVVSCVKVMKCGNAFIAFTMTAAPSLKTCAHMRSVLAGSLCSSLTNYNFRSDSHFSMLTIS